MNSVLFCYPYGARAAGDYDEDPNDHFHLIRYSYSRLSILGRRLFYCHNILLAEQQRIVGGKKPWWLWQTRQCAGLWIRRMWVRIPSAALSIIKAGKDEENELSGY